MSARRDFRERAAAHEAIQRDLALQLHAAIGEAVGRGLPVDKARAALHWQLSRMADPVPAEDGPAEPAVAGRA